MHRIRRIIGLAGALAAIVATLSVGTVAAAGPSVVGHVYVNNNSAGQNTIAAFDRHRDGSLSPIAGSPFPAGGAGTGNPYGSAGGLQETADGRFLLATDPASNQISVLRIKRGGAIQLVDVADSHGSSPVSIAIHGSLVYVANGGAGGSNYTGFRLDVWGHLRHIPGSTFALPDTAMPGHILISPDGHRLVATRVGPSAGPSFIDGFRIGGDGRLTAATGSPFGAQRIGPFGAPSRRCMGASSSSRMHMTVRTQVPCPRITSGATDPSRRSAGRRSPTARPRRAGSPSAPMGGPCSRSTRPSRPSLDTPSTPKGR